MASRPILDAPPPAAANPVASASALRAPPKRLLPPSALPVSAARPTPPPARVPAAIRSAARRPSSIVRQGPAAPTAGGGAAAAPGSAGSRAVLGRLQQSAVANPPVSAVKASAGRGAAQAAIAAATRDLGSDAVRRRTIDSLAKDTGLGDAAASFSAALNPAPAGAAGAAGSTSSAGGGAAASPDQFFGELMAKHTAQAAELKANLRGTVTKSLEAIKSIDMSGLTSADGPLARQFQTLPQLFGEQDFQHVQWMEAATNRGHSQHHEALHAGSVGVVAPDSAPDSGVGAPDSGVAAPDSSEQGDALPKGGAEGALPASRFMAERMRSETAKFHEATAAALKTVQSIPTAAPKTAASAGPHAGAALAVARGAAEAGKRVQPAVAAASACMPVLPTFPARLTAEQAADINRNTKSATTSLRRTRPPPAGPAALAGSGGFEEPRKPPAAEPKKVAPETSYAPLKPADAALGGTGTGAPGLSAGAGATAGIGVTSKIADMSKQLREQVASSAPQLNQQAEMVQSLATQLQHWNLLGNKLGSLQTYMGVFGKHVRLFLGSQDDGKHHSGDTSRGPLLAHLDADTRGWYRRNQTAQTLANAGCELLWQGGAPSDANGGEKIKRFQLQFHDLVVDPQGRPIAVGTAWNATEQRLNCAVACFRPDGRALDPSFCTSTAPPAKGKRPDPAANMVEDQMPEPPGASSSPAAPSLQLQTAKAGAVKVDLFASESRGVQALVTPDGRRLLVLATVADPDSRQLVASIVAVSLATGQLEAAFGHQGRVALSADGFEGSVAVRMAQHPSTGDLLVLLRLQTEKERVNKVRSMFVKLDRTGALDAKFPFTLVDADHNDAVHPRTWFANDIAWDEERIVVAGTVASDLGDERAHGFLRAYTATGGLDPTFGAPYPLVTDFVREHEAAPGAAAADAVVAAHLGEATVAEQKGSIGFLQMLNRAEPVSAELDGHLAVEQRAAELREARPARPLLSQAAATAAQAAAAEATAAQAAAAEATPAQAAAAEATAAQAAAAEATAAQAAAKEATAPRAGASTAAAGPPTAPVLTQGKAKAAGVHRSGLVLVSPPRAVACVGQRLLKTGVGLQLAGTCYDSAQSRTGSSFICLVDELGENQSTTVYDLGAQHALTSVQSVAVSRDGQTRLLVGYALRNAAQMDSADAFLIKVDASGKAVQKSRITLGGEFHQSLNAAVALPSGAFFAAGTVQTGRTQFNRLGCLVSGRI
jgi:hypothetical protein